MSYLVNPYMVTAAGGYWYEHINETDIDTYFLRVQGRRIGAGGSVCRKLPTARAIH